MGPNLLYIFICRLEIAPDSLEAGPFLDGPTAKLS